jgi:hypothetical protein
VCTKCNTPCQTCSNKNASHCTSCNLDNLLLYDGTCVEYCPSKYIANNKSVNECVYIGLLCPEGYAIKGDNCIPSV